MSIRSSRFAPTAIRPTLAFRPAELTRVEWAATGLAATTGVVHLYLYLTQEFAPFLFAAAVFGLIVAGMLVVPAGEPLRRAMYALAVPFTAGQIGVWIVLGAPDLALGVVDKAVQVAFIATTIYLFRAEM